MLPRSSWTFFYGPLLIISLQGCTTPATADRAIAHWSLDEDTVKGTTILDTGDGHHDGEILRAKLVAGRRGQALEFENPGDGITIPDLDLEGTQQPVMLWIKKKAGGVRRLIYINGLYQVGLTDDQVFVHTGRLGRADPNMPLASLGIPHDQWTHLAVTWDTAAPSDNVKVYMNGQLRAKGTLDKARDKPLKIRRLYVGHSGDVDAIHETFIGTIDEVAVFNTALSATAIATHYNRMAQGAGILKSAPRDIISQAVASPPLYFPRSPYEGPKKLLRVASELISRMLYSPSIAEAQLPRRVRLWQDRGLDGLIFNITSHDRTDSDRKYWNMAGQWWAMVRRTYKEFIPDIKAFQSVKDWGRLTDNFLWSSYAVWKDGERLRCQDWFRDEDWEIILENVQLQARVARECGFVGILLDTEQYNGHHALGTWHIPFNYVNYKEEGYLKEGRAKPRSFDQVAAQIRKRGTQYTRAVCRGYPGLKILVIPGLYEWAAHDNTEPLESRHYGLYPAFIDGMIEGMDAQATLIGGSEMTYSKTRYSHIGNERKRFDDAIENLADIPAMLQKKMSFAAGIWVDIGRTWSDTDVSQNIRNPTEHEWAVRNAFRASAEYSWIYGEQSHFLGDTPTPLMFQYFKANTAAHDLGKTAAERP